MNLKNYLMGLFRGHSANGELQQVEEAGRQDARLMIGTYVNAFEAEAAKILSERQQRFIGFSEPEPEEIDVEFDFEPDAPESAQSLTAADLRGLVKAELIKLAKKRKIEADETWTVKELRAELVG